MSVHRFEGAAPITAPHGRAGRVAAVAAVAFAVLAARVVALQITRPHAHLATIVREASPRVWHAGVRGRLLDRRGAVLAQDTAALRIEVDSRAVPHATQLVDALASELSWSSARRHDVEVSLASMSGTERGRRTLDRAARPSSLERLVRVLRAFPGVHVVASTAREYPHGDEFFHVVGFASAEGAAPDARHTPAVLRGRSGAERVFEHDLRAGEWWERPAPPAADGVRDDVRWSALATTAREPQASALPRGRDVRLTLDATVQHALADAFEQTHVETGAAVILEAHTGRVVAAYSRPTLDPNQFAATLAESDWQRERDAAESPLLDRYAARAATPGWVFVPFVVAHTLESQMWDPDAEIECRGQMEIGHRIWHDTAAHGPHTDLARALASHCYLYLFDVAQSVSMDAMLATARDFGLGARTGFAGSPEAVGDLPDRASITRRTHRWRLGYAMNAGVGLGGLQVTPVQLAVAWGALLNGGTVLEPTILDAVEGLTGSFEPVGPTAPRRSVRLAAEARSELLRIVTTAAEARDGLDVDLAGFDAHPLAVRRSIDEPEVHNVWFAGYSPRRDPRYVIVVLAERQIWGPEPARAIAAAAARALATSDGGRS